MDKDELIQQYIEGERDFSGIDLPQAKLSQADLAEINLSGANLPGVDLKGANLQDADLSWAELQDADLRGASLINADLSYAKLRNANLSGANLENAYLVSANLREADLSKANLQDADLTDAILGGAILPESIDEDQLVMAMMLDTSAGESYEDAMKAWVDETFMNEALPGFEMGIDDLGAYLEQYGFDPYEPDGKQIILHFIKHAVDGWYGDFNRFASCSSCGKQFQPNYDLDYAYQVLAGYKMLCPSCNS
jgi:hypothetical protein